MPLSLLQQSLKDALFTNDYLRSRIGELMLTILEQRTAMQDLKQRYELMKRGVGGVAP